MSQGQRAFIQPQHPLIREISLQAGAKSPVLERVLAATQRRCRYVSSPPGQRSFDDLLSDLRQAEAEGRRLDLNCINLACVVVSSLRAAGFSPWQALVAVGARRGELRFDALKTPHAWAAVRSEQGLKWIDPGRLEPEPATSAEVLAAHNLYVLFNDQILAFTEEDKAQILREMDAEDRPQVHLFGKPDLSLWSLARTPEMERLIRQFFRRPSATGDRGAEEVYRQAIARGLLRRAGEKFEPGYKLVLVSREAEQELYALVGPLLDHYTHVVAAALPHLRRAYGCCRPRDRFGWQEVAHTVVAGLFMDLAVGRRLGIAREVDGAQDGNALWIFEAVSATNGFGVQWVRDPRRRSAFGQLWHRRVERQPPGFGPRALELMAAVAAGGAPASSSREWLLLRHFGLVQGGRGQRPGLGFPAFQPEDTERLLPPLCAGAERVVEEVLEPAFRQAAAHPLWRRAADRAPYRHAIVRLLLEAATDRVVEAGLVPPFPSDGELVPGWGRWLWMEAEGSLSIFPEHSAAPVEERCPATT